MNILTVVCLFTFHYEMIQSKSFCSDPSCQPWNTPYPNMQAALVGYNPLTADPLDGNDPGMRQQIFEPTTLFSDDDTRLDLADFLSARKNLVCEKVMTTTVTRNFQEYFSEKTKDASFNSARTEDNTINFLFFKSGSVTSTVTSESSRMGKMKKFFEERQGEVYMSKAVCKTQHIEVDKYSKKVFTPAFIRNLRVLDRAASLPNNSQDAINHFKTFTESYGFFYLSSIEMGAKLTYEKVFSRRNRNKDELNNRLECVIKSTATGSSVGFEKPDVEVGLEYKGASAKTTIPGIKLSTSNDFNSASSHCDNSTSSNKYGNDNVFTSTKVYSVGSRPISLDQWSQQKFTPAPIRFKLTDISELFNPSSNPFLVQDMKDILDFEEKEPINLNRLYNFYTSLRVDYCRLILKKECHDTVLKGCGLNSECGYGAYSGLSKCINAPAEELGYRCEISELEKLENLRRKNTRVKSLLKFNRKTLMSIVKSRKTLLRGQIIKSCVIGSC